MITTRQELKKCLALEKDFYKPSFFGYIAAWFGLSESNLIWKYQKRLRKWEYHLNSKHRLRTYFYKALTLKIGYKLGFHISPNCIDSGLHILHIGPILINSNSKIGKECLLNVGVSFVSTSGNNDAPIVGDFCKIGVGATLIGNIQLGDEVAIGAGAVVTKSFNENHITIAGVPAKIISNNGVL